jgi:hypothetical protein
MLDGNVVEPFAGRPLDISPPAIKLKIEIELARGDRSPLIAAGFFVGGLQFARNVHGPAIREKPPNC